MFRIRFDLFVFNFWNTYMAKICRFSVNCGTFYKILPPPYFLEITTMASQNKMISKMHLYHAFSKTSQFFAIILSVNVGSWPLVSIACPKGHINQFSALNLCRKTGLHMALWQIRCLISRYVLLFILWRTHASCLPNNLMLNRWWFSFKKRQLKKGIEHWWISCKSLVCDINTRSESSLDSPDLLFT